MAIYVKFAEEKKPKSIKEFLNKLYTKERSNYYARAVDTFKNRECTQLQSNHMYRSFDDLLELTETYYPSTTAKKLIKLLLDLKISIPNTNNHYNPHLGVCGGMDKIRFIPHRSIGFSNITTKMNQSKYTWNELLEPLGIKDLNTFKKYIKYDER